MLDVVTANLNDPECYLGSGPIEPMLRGVIEYLHRSGEEEWERRRKSLRRAAA